MRLRDMPRELLLLTVAMIVANTAGGMFFPLLPLYLEQLGASVQQVGVYFTLNIVLGLLSRILGGWISDHTGRLPTIALGGICGTIGYAGFILAPTWEWVMIGALFGQMSASLVLPSFQAYTAEQAPEGKTSSTFGLVNGLFMICMVIGPLIGGVVAQFLGYRVLAWSAGIIYALATVMRVWMARGTRFEMRQLQPRELVRDVRGVAGMLLAGGLLTWLFITDGLIDASSQIAMPFMPKYITDLGGLSEAAFGGLMAWMPLVAAAAMVPAGMLADRFGERRIIAFGLVMSTAAWSLAGASVAPLALIGVFTLGGLAQAFFGPAFSALVSKAVPQESLGITWGIFMTALGVLAIPAPTIGGLIYDNISPHVTFFVAALSTLLAIPLVLRYLVLPPAAKPADAVPSEAVPAVTK